MKNVFKILILTLLIGLSGCTGFYISGTLHDGSTYQNRYSTYNPYYPSYHTVTVIKPLNYSHWYNNNSHHHHHNKYFKHRSK